MNDNMKPANKTKLDTKGEKKKKAFPEAFNLKQSTGQYTSFKESLNLSMFGPHKG